MKYLLRNTAFAILLLATACKKNNANSSNVKTMPIYLPANYIFGSASGTPNATYQFDNNNRVTHFTVGTTSDTQFTYDNSDRVTEINVYNGAVLSKKTIYTYNANTLSEQTTNYISGIATTSYTAIITLNSNQKPIKRDYGAGSYREYVYNQAGNLSTMDYQTPSYHEVTTYTFDNNKSWLLNIRGNYYIYTGDVELTNNILSVSTVSSSGSTLNSIVNYTYNADGYPINSTTTGNPNTTNAVTLNKYFNYIVK